MTDLILRCHNCGCSGSLAALRERLERDRTTPFWEKKECNSPLCSCHTPPPTDLHVRIEQE